MLSTPAFNALLKILEEPPAHLMFILATTELHKVPGHHPLPVPAVLLQAHPARDRSPSGWRYVAGAGGHRPDRGRGGPAGPPGRRRPAGRPVPAGPVRRPGGHQWTSRRCWTPWAWRAIWRPPRLMEQIARRDTAAALETLARLYAGGKDVGALLGELSALARDLLMRKTAPQGRRVPCSPAAMTRPPCARLGELFTAPAAGPDAAAVLQATAADLPRSGNRRTDAELCLIRLCDETPGRHRLAGLAARVARLEELLAAGRIPPPQQPGRSGQETARAGGPAAPPGPQAAPVQAGPSSLGGGAARPCPRSRGSGRTVDERAGDRLPAARRTARRPAPGAPAGAPAGGPDGRASSGPTWSRRLRGKRPRGAYPLCATRPMVHGTAGETERSPCGRRAISPGP